MHNATFHHYNISKNAFTGLKIPSVSTIHFFHHSLKPWQPLIFFFFYYLCSFNYSRITIASQPLWNFLGIICNWTLYTQGKDRPKKEGDHSSLADGKPNKEGYLHRRLVWGWWGWGVTTSADSLTYAPSLKPLYKSLHLVQSPMPSRLSQNHIFIWRLYSRNNFWEQGR